MSLSTFLEVGNLIDAARDGSREDRSPWENVTGGTIMVPLQIAWL